MRVFVAIVNYRTARLVVDCLASLEPEVRERGDVRVIVVDNPGGGDDLEVLRAAITEHGWGGWCELIAAERNGGFSYGNNLVIRQALAASPAPAFVHLLNPDTVVHPRAITELVDYLDDHPEAGIAGSRLEDPDGTAQGSAFRFPSVWSELDTQARFGVLTRVLQNHVITYPIPSAPRRVDWVAGASMLIRTALFERVGLFDEDYFLYFEEVDFCLQAHRAGVECHYVPASRVVHLVGQSTGVTDPKRARRRLPKFWFESRRRYFVKNHSRDYAVLADLAFAGGHVVGRAKARALGQTVDTPERVLADLGANSAAFQATPRSAPRSLLELVDTVREDWAAHGHDWTRPGFRAVAIHRFGVWRMQVEPKALRAPLSVVYRGLFRYARNHYGIELPYTVALGRRVVVEHQHGIVIHGEAAIGDDCIIRQGVTIGIRRLDRLHDAPRLGRGVNVGAGAVILGAIRVGDGASIGANAVVLHDVPEGALAVGIPAKLVSSG